MALHELHLMATVARLFDCLTYDLRRVRIELLKNGKMLQLRRRAADEGAESGVGVEHAALVIERYCTDVHRFHDGAVTLLSSRQRENRIFVGVADDDRVCITFADGAECILRFDQAAPQLFQGKRIRHRFVHHAGSPSCRWTSTFSVSDRSPIIF